MSLLKSFLGFSLAAILVGCGGGGGSSSGDTSTTGTGYYEDSAIVGADYSCGAQSGVTGSDGSFTFESGQGCEFKIGDIHLRGVDASELKDGVRVVENTIPVAQFLQSIDVDGDPTNGITITQEVKTALKNANITSVPTGELANIVNMLKNSVEGFEGKFVSIEEAINHLMKNDELARATASTKALLSDKTFYVPTENGIVEVSFDGDVEKFISPSDEGDGNTVDDILVVGNKILWRGDLGGGYAVVSQQKDYILFADYEYNGHKEGEHRLYPNRADAQKYYDEVINQVIPITEDMLAGKTFYGSSLENDDTEMAYYRFSFVNSTLTYTAVYTDLSGKFLRKESVSTPYTIENGKIKMVWTEDDYREIEYDTLKVQTSNEWTIKSKYEIDWNNDGTIDEVDENEEFQTWYLSKPSNFPAEL